MKLVKVSRSDILGSYVVPLEELDIRAELDDLDYLDIGMSVMLTVVEMPEEQYKVLAEFEGW